MALHHFVIPAKAGIQFSARQLARAREVRVVLL